MFHIPSLWDTQIRTTMKYMFNRVSTIFKLTILSIDMDEEQLEGSYTGGENVKWPNTVKNSLAIA